MKTRVLLLTSVLGSWMFVAAQQPPASSSTPSTFPQSQSTEQPVNPQQPANQMPPDTHASKSDESSTAGSSQASSSETTSVEGCLTQLSSNNQFRLTDQAGNSYQLQGDSSELSQHLNQQVRIKASLADTGSAVSKAESSTPTPDSSTQTGGAGSNTSGSKQLNVSSVEQLSNTCSAPDNAPKTPR
ncbi:MAG TPA: hypothetical protein VFP40_16345 [Terriglobales bacterium]|nr:hypothetical protein [Terriglobales bacterium]